MEREEAFKKRGESLEERGKARKSLIIVCDENYEERELDERGSGGNQRLRDVSKQEREGRGRKGITTVENRRRTSKSLEK